MIQKLARIQYGEALMYGKKVCVTPLPYLDELSLTNENSFILDFNLKNIKDVVEKIKSLQLANNSLSTNYKNILKDNYRKYLAKGKSHYIEEMRNKMAKIRIKTKFRDMKHNNIIRYVGEELVEDEERAKDLVARGFATMIEEVIEKPQPVEQAVKEVKKEKAVKETAKKVVKKNAKK